MAGLTVLDASTLIAVFDGGDAHADAAAHIVEEAEQLAVSSLTLAEALLAPTAAGAADQFIAIVQRLGIAEIGLPAGSAAPLAELRAQTGLKLPDCCVLLAATQAGAAAVAARDERLRRRAGELGFATP